MFVCSSREASQYKGCKRIKERMFERNWEIVHEIDHKKELTENFCVDQGTENVETSQIFWKAKGTQIKCTTSMIEKRLLQRAFKFLGNFSSGYTEDRQQESIHNLMFLCLHYIRQRITLWT